MTLKKLYSVIKIKPKLGSKDTKAYLKKLKNKRKK
jgi:hypothetical protein